MRGWPIGEALALGAFLAFLLWPLHGFTFGRRPHPGPDPAPAPMTVSAATPPDSSGTDVVLVHASVRFAHGPERCVIRHEGVVLWEMDPATALRASRPLPLPLPGTAPSMELLVDVVWPEGTPDTVVELTLEPDGLEGVTRTAWGRGTFSGPLSFTWPDPAP
jgi:hypothetical protein